MNADLQAAGEARRKTRKTVLSLIGGGIIGFLGANAMMSLVKSGQLGEPDISTIAALAVGLVYALTGLIVIAGLVSPGAGARFLNVEDAEELIEQKPALVASGWGMVVMGMVLAVIALGGKGGVIEPLVALGLAAVLMAVGASLSLRSLRHSDELMRAVSVEATQVSYYLLLCIVGGWAALAHVGLVAGPTMLDLLTAFWAFMLVATFWLAGRRGMLKPR